MSRRASGPTTYRYMISKCVDVPLVFARAAPYGQGNRVKELCGDEACEEVVIPGGDFAAESEGILSPGSPD